MDVKENSWPEPEKPEDVKPWSRSDLEYPVTGAGGTTSEVLRSAFGLAPPDPEQEARVLRRLKERGPWMPAPLAPLIYVWVLQVLLFSVLVSVLAAWVAYVGLIDLFAGVNFLFTGFVLCLLAVQFYCLFGLLSRRRRGLLVNRRVLLGWSVAFGALAVSSYLFEGALMLYSGAIALGLLLFAALVWSLTGSFETWFSRLSTRQVRRLERLLETE